jgi:hypothetical protein
VKIKSVSFLLLIFGALILFLIPTTPTHPTDEEMIQNFNSNQQHFETLLGMVKEDKELTGIYGDGSLPTFPQVIEISEKRVNTYLNFFKLCNIPEGIRAFRRDEEIAFVASTSGMAVNGSSKSYVYMVKPLAEYSKIVDSTDAYDISSVTRATSIFRHLDGNWYIEYLYDP